MPVVRHDAIGDKGGRVPGQTLSQNPEKLAIIARSGEERRLPRGAIDDVKVVIRQ
jgi:hypothetical protein